MAASSSSSSSSSRPWRYDVFPSFSRKDVRKAFLSLCHKEFQRKGIKTFEDQEIRKGQTIPPELVQSIRESKISIVILSKNYASSSWCLNELLEIVNCKETVGQKVMTIFYAVDPSDVRKQTGEFGNAFKKTCAKKTTEQKQRWSKALTDVANMAGYHSTDWDKETDVIEKIATDVLKELNPWTESKDFDDDLVGIETHMAKLNLLLCLETSSSAARMVGICGPPGIGKTTLARVLSNRLCGNFQLNCYMENIGGIFRRSYLDNYKDKLHLQKLFLSRDLDTKDIEVPQLGVAQQKLNYLKVLVVLDGVDKYEQLETLAKEVRWVGAGSRIIVTTHDKGILDARGINHVYRMKLPSEAEALQIFCQSAFKQRSPPNDFRDLAEEVAKLASKLPLGLNVLGSSLQGLSKDEWILQWPRLKTSLDGRIEEVLTICYDCLAEKDQAIFRHIACLFNHEHVNRVIDLLDDSGLDIELGLNVLEKRGLIQIDKKWIRMHSSLQQLGREMVRKQSISKPGKREFIVGKEDAQGVLTQNTGREAVLSLTLDQDVWMDDLCISPKAFERMTNLRFLRLGWSRIIGKNNKFHLPQGLNYLPPKLRSLHWNDYPMKSLPSDFCPKHLVELIMKSSKLERLWDETKVSLPGRLVDIDLSSSLDLKELPDLSKAINLWRLNLSYCRSLVMLPSSIRNCHRLKSLNMSGCASLELLPTNINLTSLSDLNLQECRQLRYFPEISQNIENLYLQWTAIEEVPSSVALWSNLTILNMSDCIYLKTFPHVSKCIEILKLARTKIEEVPAWIENLIRLRNLDLTECKRLRNISLNIFKLKNLETLDVGHCNNLESFSPSLESSTDNQSEVPFKLHRLYLRNCKRLVSLPKLPSSISVLCASNCESLERISNTFNNQEIELSFVTCLKLNQEARELIQQSLCKYAYLPGSKLPPYITHRARGSSLTIRSDKMPVSGVMGSKPYLLLAATITNGHWEWDTDQIKCHVKGHHGGVVFQLEWNTNLDPYNHHFGVGAQSDHLIIFRIFYWPKQELSQNQIMLEFNCLAPHNSKVKEFGVQLLDSAYACEGTSSKQLFYDRKTVEISPATMGNLAPYIVYEY